MKESFTPSSQEVTQAPERTAEKTAQEREDEYQRKRTQARNEARANMNPEELQHSYLDQLEESVKKLAGMKKELDEFNDGLNDIFGYGPSEVSMYMYDADKTIAPMRREMVDSQKDIDESLSQLPNDVGAEALKVILQDVGAEDLAAINPRPAPERIQYILERLDQNYNKKLDQEDGEQ